MALSPNPNLQALIAASPLQRELVEFLRGELALLREGYENNAASEFTRGQINNLRDVLEFIEGYKK